jgi:hypothetical protein
MVGALLPHSYSGGNRLEHIEDEVSTPRFGFKDTNNPSSVDNGAGYVAPLIRTPPPPVPPGFVLASQNISTKTFLFSENLGSDTRLSQSRNRGHVNINLNDSPSSSGNSPSSQGFDVGILNEKCERINWESLEIAELSKSPHSISLTVADAALIHDGVDFSGGVVSHGVADLEISRSAHASEEARDVTAGLKPMTLSNSQEGGSRIQLVSSPDLQTGGDRIHIGSSPNVQASGSRIHIGSAPDVQRRGSIIQTIATSDVHPLENNIPMNN